MNDSKVAVILYFNEKHPDVINGELTFSERIDYVRTFDTIEQAERFIDNAVHFETSTFLLTRVQEVS